MRIKNKIVGTLLFLTTLVQAEVSTFVPYYAALDYNSKSTKSSGTVNGFYVNSGTLNYLIEASFSHTNIKYKDSIANLTQDEFTVIYNKYTKTYSIKAGIHTNNTTDTNLQNGTTLILGFSKWKYKGYDKLSYGMDYYNSYYANGTNLDNNSTKVRVHQFSPFISYSKAININTRDIISLKANFETIDAYSSEKTYSSFEVKNTLYYKKLYATLGILSGKLRTGIKDGGMTVYNSKDIIKNIYNIKLGYYVNTKLNVNLSYSNSKYDEFNGNKDTKSSATIVTASYKF